MAWGSDMIVGLVTHLPQGEWQMLSPGKVRKPAEGWDTRETRLILFDESVADEAELDGLVPDGLERGWIGYQPNEDVNLWCQEVEFECVTKGLWIASLMCAGLVSPKVAVRRADGYTETQSAENVFDPDGFWKKEVVYERGISLELSYISLTEPDMTVVGSNVTPEDAPEGPESGWTLLTDPTHHFPHGWVLTGRPWEKLVNVPAWKVTDKFVRQHEFSP